MTHVWIQHSHHKLAQVGTQYMGLDREVLPVIVIPRILKSNIMFSDDIFHMFSGILPDLRTEKHFFRWAERLVENTPFSAEDGKTLLLRAHKEAFKLKFIDRSHEDMIFSCLHRTWTNLAVGNRIDAIREFRVSPKMSKEFNAFMSKSRLIFHGSKDVTVQEAVWEEEQEEVNKGTAEIQSNRTRNLLVHRPASQIQKKKIRRCLNDIDPKAILRRRYRRQYARVTVHCNGPASSDAKNLLSAGNETNRP